MTLEALEPSAGAPGSKEGESRTRVRVAIEQASTLAELEEAGAREETAARPRRS